MGLLNAKVAEAIDAAAAEVAAGAHDAQFPIDVFQTGSGTSTNMNANEVIAALASRRLGRPVHPNDDVNMARAATMSIPTAIHVSAALTGTRELLPALEHLRAVLLAKEQRGRRYRQDRPHAPDGCDAASPSRQELSGLAHADREWTCAPAQRSSRACWRSRRAARRSAPASTRTRNSAARFCAELAALTGLPFVPARNYFEALSAQDTAVELSGQLKVIAVSLMKIANDLRWMNSGPLAGLGEIALPALQPGSSIMPGKVNPVIPEATAMVAAQVIGNDTTITIAGQSGNFQLNVMLPVIAHNLLREHPSAGERRAWRWPTAPSPASR